MAESLENNRILFTGGGSGGHIYPLLSVLKALEKQSQEKKIEFYYLGVVDENTRVLEEAGVKVEKIITGKMRRYFSLLNVLDIPKFFVGLFQALFKMLLIMPDVVFSKGGPGSFPVVLSAWFYRIPVIIHESDAYPGLSNALSSHFARRIAVSFPSTVKYFPPSKVILTGNPVRESFLEGYKLNQAVAKQTLGFSPNYPLLLVLGGSLGSTRINETLILDLKKLISETQILHQTGRANYLDVKKLALAELVDVPLREEAQKRYQAVPYLDKEFPTALQAADLIVTRAGSGAIFEIAASGKPAVLIPLPESANDHQRINAYEFAKTGGAIVLEEANLLPGILFRQISKLLKSPELLSKMGEFSKKFFQAGAAEAIAQEILSFI